METTEVKTIAFSAILSFSSAHHRIIDIFILDEKIIIKNWLEISKIANIPYSSGVNSFVNNGRSINPMSFVDKLPRL